MNRFLVFLSCVILISSGLFSTAKGQTGYSYNFNINNGLPSNLIYEVITDRHGYLWIATLNGVVRYNGYDFKVFTTADGLPTNDVWQLLEDNKGRIWLGNISDEFGYLFDGKYHKAFLKGYNRTVYPMDLRVNGEGLIFYSGLVNGGRYPSICVEKNDTIHINTYNTYSYERFNDLDNFKPKRDESIKYIKLTFINSLGEVYSAYNYQLFKVESLNDTSHLIKLFEIEPDFYANHIYSGKKLLLGNYLVSYTGKNNDPYIYITNVLNGHISKIQLSKYCNINSVEYVANCQDNLHLYIISKYNILLFDYKDSIKFNRTISLNALEKSFGINGTKIRAFENIMNWGNIFGTTSSGIAIKYNQQNKFKKWNITDLNNYTLLGIIRDSLSFWSNGASHRLISVLDNGAITNYSYKDVSRLRSINYFGKDSIFIHGSPTFLLTLHNKKIISLSDTVIGHGVLSSVRINKSVFAVIASAGFSIREKQKNIYENNILDLDKYSGLLVDSLRKLLIVYNLNKIFIHGPVRDTSLLMKSFSEFGVKKLQQMLVDNTYGNYIFKGPDNLTLYDPEKTNYINIFKNINLTESSILLHNNIIIAYGKFGIGFCKITGRKKVSEEIIYRNINNINYRSVNNCVAYNNKLLLSTDNGNYSIEYPADSEYKSAKNEDYARSVIYLYKYQDSTKQLKSLDTIKMAQADRKLQFDIINPYGNGHIHYLYRLTGDTDWHELNANELNIPILYEPGKYYTLLLKVNDDVWKSDPMIVTFYIHPYWYQTQTGSRIIWTLIAGIFLIVLAVAVLLTRRLVLNAARKRTMRLELELKAIYAQINPHFIFNTLNSAMMMAKKSKADDIYEHIAKFSSLLRGYIKSSRNKYITIEEEIENIKDYIELQQARFKNKFNYSIKIDNNIKSDQVRIPSLLIQPFVENAINHGLLPLEANGFLKIEFRYEKVPNEIVCTIEDNGIGRKNSKLLNEQNKQRGESYGDLLIKDLVAIFNRYETMNIEIVYQDQEIPQTGTRVTIKIKNPQHAE